MQSDSLPGRVEPSRAFFRRMLSRALRAASRARLAISAFSRMDFPTPGFSSRNCSSLSLTTAFTRVRISLLPSFALVWPSNWASVSLTEITQVKPSRQSSPDTFSSPLNMPAFLP